MITTDAKHHCHGYTEVLVGISRMRLVKPRARPNRSLSRNARKDFQRRCAARHRNAALRRAAVELVTEFTSMRLRERSFFSMVMSPTKDT